MTGRSTQDIEDLIEMAGFGIGYWASSAVVTPHAYTVTEAETGAAFRLSFADLRAAWRKIIAGDAGVGPRIIGYLASGDMGDVDSDAADCVVQVACFGELVYG